MCACAAEEEGGAPEAAVLAAWGCSAGAAALPGPPADLASLASQLARSGAVRASLRAGAEFHVYTSGVYADDSAGAGAAGGAAVPALVVGLSRAGGPTSRLCAVVDPGLGALWGSDGLMLVPLDDILVV